MLCHKEAIDDGPIYLKPTQHLVETHFQAMERLYLIQSIVYMQFHFYGVDLLVY
jgi:hypothetical protein